MQSPQQKRSHSPPKRTEIQEGNDHQTPNGADGKARPSKQRKVVQQNLPPRVRTRVPATKVPVEQQAFQAYVRQFYKNQDDYQGEDQILSHKQQTRRGSDVDLFFRNHVDPQTWWILPTITSEFTPTAKRGDQNVINLLYSDTEIWSKYDRPNLEYLDLPGLTESLMKSLDFQQKWRRARDSVHGSGGIGGGDGGGDGGDGNEDDEVSDGGDGDDASKKWMQFSAGGAGGVVATDSIAVIADVATGSASHPLSNQEEYIQCRRAAALLGYYVITRSMRGWKDGKAPQKDSVDYKCNTGNIFFEVPVNITARGPITSMAVLQRLLDALANARITAQSQFDYIFQADRMLKLKFPTEEDRKAALQERCPFKMSEKDGSKKDQMIRICKKAMEVLSDLFQKVIKSQGISISAAITTGLSHHDDHDHHDLLPSSPPAAPAASAPSAPPLATIVASPPTIVDGTMTTTATTTASLQVPPSNMRLVPLDGGSPEVPVQIEPATMDSSPNTTDETTNTADAANPAVNPATPKPRIIHLSQFN